MVRDRQSIVNPDEFFVEFLLNFDRLRENFLELLN